MIKKLLNNNRSRFANPIQILAVTAIVTVATTTMVAVAPSAGAASVTGPSFNQCNGQWWSQDVCKYNQTSTLVIGGTLYMYAKGATASGACDPSNDTLWIESDGNRIFRTGVAIAGYGGAGRWTNCEMPAGAQWMASRALDSGTLLINYFFSYSVNGSVRSAATNGAWTINP